MTPGTDWIDQAQRLIEAVRSGLAAPTDGEQEHTSDCRWCPICLAASVVRGERPEINAALADALTAAATALRTVAAAGHPAEDAPDAGPATREDEPPPVQQIEIA
ncbi:UNVERIFIED_ORG: hypothetical protein E4P37_10955 [Bacillus sp. AZ43]